MPTKDHPRTPLLRTPQQYAVAFELWDVESERLVTARRRGEARYLAWLDIAEPTGLGFGDFVRCVSSVRVVGRRTRYDYARERYGVDVAAGDRVRCLEQAGVVAEPPGSNPRSNYIWVIVGELSARPYHPSDVTALARHMDRDNPNRKHVTGG
jgi:hypothetical protein